MDPEVLMSIMNYDMTLSTLKQVYSSPISTKLK